MRPKTLILAALMVIDVGVLPVTAQVFDLVITKGRVLDPESGLDAMRNVARARSRFLGVRPPMPASRSMIETPRVSGSCSSGRAVGPRSETGDPRHRNQYQQARPQSTFRSMRYRTSLKLPSPP